jgi:3-oxoacyl-[acyl-carrier-protein] synthase-3
MNDAFVTGIGVFLPNAPVGNDEIEHVLGFVNKFSSRLKKRVLKQNGILTRYYAIDPATGEETHNNAQMTARAVETMARGAGLSLEEIDCLVCGTSSADQLIPSHACMVHAELDCPPCEVASTSGVCCSGMSAFKYGYLHVASGSGSNAVVTGSEYSSVTLRSSHFRAPTHA